MSSFFDLLSSVNEFLWGYINFFVIMTIGLYLTFKSRFFQFRTAFHFRKTIKDLLQTTKKEQKKGINPVRLYFASIGGSIGLGNVVAIVTTVSIGGPGGLFWMWVAVFLGMLVKYAEIYLGIVYRQQNSSGGYDGGPMYYLLKAFKWKKISTIFCILMCIYGVEIYQFKVIEDVFVETFNWNRYITMAVLLVGTLYITLGGLNRLATVCTILMPIFLVSYTFVCLWVIFHNLPTLVPILKTIVTSAFNGHAAVGGFAGSTFIIAAQYGMSNAVYSGDIGMGYDSVIQSETQLTNPMIQAKATIFSLLTDCAVCTLTVLLVLSTGVWCDSSAHGVDMVIHALSGYFSHVDVLMSLFFFLVGWTTILGFLAVGVKSVTAISPKARPFYLLYACSAFVVFSFVDQNQARLVMYISGALLMLINLIAIFKLRREISFD